MDGWLTGWLAGWMTGWPIMWLTGHDWEATVRTLSFYPAAAAAGGGGESRQAPVTSDRCRLCCHRFMSSDKGAPFYQVINGVLVHPAVHLSVHFAAWVI